MAKLIFSSSLQLPDGAGSGLELVGNTVRDLLVDLELHFPGSRIELVSGDKLRPGIRVAVDGELSNLGLHQRVDAESEVLIFQAVFGG